MELKLLGLRCRQVAFPPFPDESHSVGKQQRLETLSLEFLVENFLICLEVFIRFMPLKVRIPGDNAAAHQESWKMLFHTRSFALL